MSAADEIKSKLDIVTYIQQYTPLRKAGRTFKGVCSFHAEKTPSMVVDPDRQTFKCFGCGAGGDLINFAQRKHGWSFVEALEELGRMAGVEVRRQTPEQKAQYERLDTLRGLMQAAADFYAEWLYKDHDDAAATLSYARGKRGFSDETIKRFSVGYAPAGWQNTLEHLKLLGYDEEQIIETGMAVRNEQGRVYDRFRHRLMIPIRDERGRVIGFGARALNPDDNPKYLNSPQTALFDKSRTLFALDTAKESIRDKETAVIVEGYMDAVQAHQAGFNNVVAQMGTALTETQIKLLARSAKRVILALDADAAGQNATRRSLETARATLQADFGGRMSVEMRVLQLPGAKDPDDLIRERPELWAELVEKAIPVADFLIGMEMAALPVDASVPDVEAMARRLMPLLIASENNLYNQNNVQSLLLQLNRLKQARANLRGLRISEQDLLGWAEDQRQIDRAKPPNQLPARLPFRLGEPPEVPTSTSNSDEPPEPPPLDYENMLPPDMDMGDFVPEAGVPAAAPVLPGKQDRTFAMEERCLRLLLRQPDLYYLVNRKLRELAGDNRVLMDGPLGEWCADDFRQSDYHVLMRAFEDALQQDEMEPLDYLRTYVDHVLQRQLDNLMADDLDDMRGRLRNAPGGDLMIVWNHIQKFGPTTNTGAELVEKVLTLRAQRLKQEREELLFLQIDSQGEGDSETSMLYSQRVALSIQAKHLIDAELKRQTSLVRE